LEGEAKKMLVADLNQVPAVVGQDFVDQY